MFRRNSKTFSAFGETENCRSPPRPLPSLDKNDKIHLVRQDLSATLLSSIIGITTYIKDNKITLSNILTWTYNDEFTPINTKGTNQLQC